MLYGFKIATRYLTANRAQSLLLVLGVAADHVNLSGERVEPGLRADVVEDGNLISGKGLGRVFDFALTIAARLEGNDASARDHAEHIYYR